MSTNFVTDIDNTQEKTIYRINFETDKKEYYNKVQDTCRGCVDASIERICVPYYTKVVTSDKVSVPCDYLCSNCDCSLTHGRGFYVYCPRCGYRIDYSNKYFLKEGQDAIH